MNVAFACPRCAQSVRLEVAEGAASITCPACRGELLLPPDAYRDGEVSRCLVCPSTELFVRKDFPQQLGVGIVVAGILLSCVAWSLYRPYWTFGILFATAAIDVVLWFVVPNCLNCYRCDAQYRGLRGLDKHAGFDLETHERYRQQGIRLRESAQMAARRTPTPGSSAPDSSAPDSSATGLSSASSASSNSGPSSNDPQSPNHSTSRS